MNNTTNTANFKNGFYRVVTSDYYGEWENIMTQEDTWWLPAGAKDASDLLVFGGLILVAKSPRDRKPIKARLAKVDGYGYAQIDMNGCPDHFCTRKLYAELIGVKLAGKVPTIPLKGLWIKPVTKPKVAVAKKTKKTR